ncbi:hypothetical protein ZWY2020_005021 [Hordeum vulgare]|nr:hypothetical protein ZWY2020_005021 [Hordeum vulgare]
MELERPEAGAGDGGEGGTPQVSRDSTARERMKKALLGRQTRRCRRTESSERPWSAAAAMTWRMAEGLMRLGGTMSRRRRSFGWVACSGTGEAAEENLRESRWA